MAASINSSSIAGIIDTAESLNTLAGQMNLLFSSATFQNFSDDEAGSEISILRAQSSAPTSVVNDFWSDTTSKFLRVFQGAAADRQGWRPIGIGMAIGNGTGGTRVAGDVVGFTTPNDFSYNSDATAKIAGVVGESITNGSIGLLKLGGCVATVKVAGAVARGDFLKKSGSAGNEAITSTTVLNGTFAIALTAAAGPGSGTVTAYLFPYNSTT